MAPQKVPLGSKWTVLARFRDRQTVVRLALCAAGIVGTVLAVGGWHPPFPYQAGQRPPRAIHVMVDFQVENVVRTQQERETARTAVPSVFINDSQPLLNLQTSFKNRMAEIAAAEEPANLDPETRDGFRPENENQFRELRTLVASGEGLQKLVKQVHDALQPAIDEGLLGAGAQTGSRDEITIHPPGKPDQKVVFVAHVGLEAFIALEGPLHTKLFTDLKDFPEVANVVFQWLASQVVKIGPTLTFDAGTTTAERRKAADRVETQYDPYNVGEVLVPQGEPINEEQLKLLEKEHQAFVASMPLAVKLRRSGASLMLVTAMFLLVGFHVVRYEPRLARSLLHLCVLLMLFVGAVGLARLISIDPWHAEVLPLTVVVMMFSIAYGQRFALLVAFALSLLVTDATGGDLSRFFVVMGVTATAVLTLRSVRSRTTLIKVGAACGLAFFVLRWCTGTVDQQPAEFLFLDGLRGLGWCLGAGFLISGSLPFVEGLFGVSTDISLLELGDVSHPLLHELVRRAPGTYNHSISVASIAEAAAEAIGANGLLVRVGAYFHDIGKFLKPQYFVENQTNGNRHEQLAPAMSTLIIIGHVKDGADLARQYGLPQRIIDFIEQHHGTTLVEYFYHEASRTRNDRHLGRSDVEESAFRYPGPKPQTKEDGVLMLADGVESASRALSEPTPARIENLVHDLTLKRLLDGQFDESGLNLKEIRAIEDSLIKSLTAIYHGRIKYPEPRTA